METNVNRRSLLLGLAAASTAAATCSTTPAAATTMAENPRLLMLIADLPAIAAAFHEVNDEYQATSKEWDAKTPWAPDELTIKGTGWPVDVPDQPGEPEQKALGGYLWRVGDDCPRRIVVQSWEVSRELWEARRIKRRAKKTGDLADFMVAEETEARLKKLRATAEAYEREHRDIRTQARAWHSEAWKLKDARQEALELHIAAIMREEDLTMEGLLIKAQALAEWDRCGPGNFARVAFRHGQDWHGQIAASILRHAGGAQ